MPAYPLKRFRVASVLVEQAEAWLNELADDYINTSMAWFMKGDQQWVSLVFVSKALMGGNVLRPGPGRIN
jgi:hypothetical protein